MTTTSDRWTGADLTRREILTPEGVPLVFYIGRAGDRLAAFLFDALLMALLLLAVGLFGLVVGWTTGSESAVALLGFFVIRNGYFLWFEARWQGRTPGKRRVGIRVIDARGGMLRMDQLIVRNLTREVEFFYPLILLTSGETFAGAAPRVVQVVAVAWLAILLGLPLLNSERRRAGDLLAGTMVVQEPRARLLRDLKHESGGHRTARWTFTDEQLRIYGVYELQVLERLLREQADDRRALRVVSDKIRKKIGWSERVVDHHGFLTDFYDALRARLEHDLLLGRARETKRGD